MTTKDLKFQLMALADKWDSAAYAIAEVNNPLLPQEQCAIELRAALAAQPAPVTSAEPLRTEIIREIELEREAQDVKWGGPEHDDTHRREDWTHYIQRHTDIAFGDRFRKQMIRVAALAIAAIESDARAALRQPGTPAEEKR